MNYEPIVQSDPLVAQVWEIMQRHCGFAHRIDRNVLTFAVFKEVNANYDRKVRDALAELPVVWQDGYFIPKTREEAEVYIYSMLSRQVRILQRLRLLDDFLKPHTSARQLRLDEVVIL